MKFYLFLLTNYIGSTNPIYRFHLPHTCGASGTYRPWLDILVGVRFFVSEMVRTYVRKKPPPKYSKEVLDRAINAVRSQQMTLYRASKLFEIPKATLFKHLKGQRGVKSRTYGRPTAIPYEEEKKMSEYIKLMEKWGFGLSKKEVLSLIGKYINENNIQTPFKDGIPGDDYFRRFKKLLTSARKNRK